jgi:hypothetical protein
MPASWPNREARLPPLSLPRGARGRAIVAHAGCQFPQNRFNIALIHGQ